MALLQTLTDDFNDNSRDTSKWNVANTDVGTSGSVTVSETSQQLQITTVNAAGSNYSGYSSVNTFDLTGSYAAVKVVQVATGGSTDTLLYVVKDANNLYAILVENGTLYCQRKVGGSRVNITSLTYSATDHLWWRISESGGTVSFDTAPDGSTWTSRATASTSNFDITAVKAELSAGTFGANAATTAIFDSFNPVTTQVAVPISDLAAGSWIGEGGETTNLYTHIDEASVNDADYVRSSLSPPTADVVRFRLGSISDPNVSTGHVLHYRIGKDVTGGDRLDLTVTLYRADGSTVVKTQTYNDVDALTTYDVTLSGSEADSIPSGDYATGLVIEFSAVKV